MTRTIAIALIMLVAPAAAETITGNARVIDADTIVIDGERIRLWGLDALELRQTCQGPAMPLPCGSIARDHLIELIHSRPVRCEIRGRGYYGRHLGVCYEGAADLNGALVEAGWAVIDPRYPSMYQAQQDGARAARRGVWATEFEWPWEWRRARRRTP